MNRPSNPKFPVAETVSHRWIELLAVLFTAVCKFIFIDALQLKFWYIIVASVIWLAYVTVKIRQNPLQVEKWGFGWKGFKASLRFLAPLAGLALIAFLTYGLWTGSLLLNWHLVFVLILYPIWGTIQHFLLIGLVAGNLSDLNFWKRSNTPVIIVTAVLFSAVHFPNIPLMSATLILALIYTYTYLRFRNLWVLGIFHGWLGAFFYYLVLGRDAWQEFTTALL